MPPSRRKPNRKRRPQRPAQRRATGPSTRTRILAGALALVVIVALVVGAVLAGHTSNSASGPVDGATIFRQRCSGCHGLTGQGGTGPKLAGGVVVHDFPDIEDQIALVTNGRDGMPAFKHAGLSKQQIRAVVEYTRTQL
jgi:mono/diheme cytochrome c family protein